MNGYSNWRKNSELENEKFAQSMINFIMLAICSLIVLVISLIFFKIKSHGNLKKEIEEYINDQTNDYCNETMTIPKRDLIFMFSKNDLEQFEKIWRKFVSTPAKFNITICSDGNDECIQGKSPKLTLKCKKNLYLEKNGKKLIVSILTFFFLICSFIFYVNFKTRRKEIKELSNKIITSIKEKKLRGIIDVSLSDIRIEFPEITDRLWSKVVKEIENDPCIKMYTKSNGTMLQYLSIPTKSDS